MLRKELPLVLCLMLLFVVHLSGALPPVSAQNGYYLTDIGTLGKTTNSYSYATAGNISLTGALGKEDPGGSPMATGTTAYRGTAIYLYPTHPFFWSRLTGIMDMGVVYGGATATPVAINRKGEVVGNTAFYWHRGLGALNAKPLFAPGDIGQIVDINDASIIIGYTGDQYSPRWAQYWFPESGAGSDPPHTYSQHTLPLPELPEGKKWDGSVAKDINNDGDIVGTCFLPYERPDGTTGRLSRTCVWIFTGNSSAPYAAQILDIGAAFNESAENPVPNSGYFIGNRVTDEEGHVFLMLTGACGTPSGGTIFTCKLVYNADINADIWEVSYVKSIGIVSYPLGLTDWGGVVGRPAQDTGIFTPDGNSFEYLGELGTDGADPCTRGINNQAQIVGWSWIAGHRSGQSHAFVWDPVAKMRDLNALVVPRYRRENNPFIYLKDAVSIMDNGLIPGADSRLIFGTGIADTHTEHAFLLEPVPTQ